jgi:hypothetical protein
MDSLHTMHRRFPSHEFCYRVLDRHHWGNRFDSHEWLIAFGWCNATSRGLAHKKSDRSFDRSLDMHQLRFQKRLETVCLDIIEDTIPAHWARRGSCFRFTSASDAVCDVRNRL